MTKQAVGLQRCPSRHAQVKIKMKCFSSLFCSAASIVILAINFPVEGKVWSREEVVSLLNQAIVDDVNSSESEMLIPMINQISPSILPEKIESTRDDLNNIFVQYIQNTSFARLDREIMAASIKSHLHEITMTIKGAELITPISRESQGVVLSQFEELYDYLITQLREEGVPQTDWFLRFSSYERSRGLQYVQGDMRNPLKYNLKRAMTAEEVVSAKSEINAIVKREAMVLKRILESTDPDAESDMAREFGRLFYSVQRIGIPQTALEAVASVTGEDLSPGYYAVIDEINAYEHRKSEGKDERKQKERNHNLLLSQLLDKNIDVHNPDAFLDENMNAVLANPVLELLDETPSQTTVGDAVEKQHLMKPESLISRESGLIFKTWQIVLFIGIFASVVIVVCIKRKGRV